MNLTDAISAIQENVREESQLRIRSFTGGLTPTKLQSVVETFKAADVELRKIFAPMGRSTELPIGMSDGLKLMIKQWQRDWGSAMSVKKKLKVKSEKLKVKKYLKF